MPEPGLPWHAGGVLPYASLWHTVLRACALNALHPRDLPSTLTPLEGASKGEPTLAAQIAIFREAINQPNSVARAVLAAIIESPELLVRRDHTDADKLKAMDKESCDFELSLLRYFAASGLAFNVLLGLTPLSGTMRNRLFTRLLDEEGWQSNTVNRWCNGHSQNGSPACSSTRCCHFL